VVAGFDDVFADFVAGCLETGCELDFFARPDGVVGDFVARVLGGVMGLSL
jgi:hypothetical protein